MDFFDFLLEEDVLVPLAEALGYPPATGATSDVIETLGDYDPTGGERLTFLNPGYQEEHSDEYPGVGEHPIVVVIPLTNDIHTTTTCHFSILTTFERSSEKPSPSTESPFPSRRGVRHRRRPERLWEDDDALNIAGLQTPTSGSIRLQGTDLTNLPPYERDIGVVFQDYALFPHKTVAENIAFGLKMRGADEREREAKVSRCSR